MDYIAPLYNLLILMYVFAYLKDANINFNELLNPAKLNTCKFEISLTFLLRIYNWQL